MTNIRYLTGFTGSAGSLIVLGDRSILVSDSRYEIQIGDECRGAIADGSIEVAICPADIERNEFAISQLNSTGATSIGYEHATISKSMFDYLAEKCDREPVRTDGWVEEARSIKNESEISAIRKSIDVNQRAYTSMLGQISGETTEREFAHNLEHSMRSLGASGVSFEPIVGVGPRAALPHGTPSDVQLGSDAFVLVDWGAKVDGYCSDLTRIFVIDHIPPKLREIYEIVLSAHSTAIRTIRPGVSVREVDAAARSVIESSGYGDYFGHGTGHSFGLEIHETPFLSPTREGILKENMVVTIEPGIYIPDSVGVRIEDDVLVTGDGYEILSNLPRELDECIVPV